MEITSIQIKTVSPDQRIKQLEEEVLELRTKLENSFVCIDLETTHQEDLPDLEFVGLRVRQYGARSAPTHGFVRYLDFELFCQRVVPQEDEYEIDF